MWDGSGGDMGALRLRDLKDLSADFAEWGGRALGKEKKMKCNFFSINNS